MTDNTNQRRRHRAVFLAFIMIVSVFGGAIAFSGSAAATEPSGSVTDNTSSDVVTNVGTAVNVTNITFATSGNISNVTVLLNDGAGSEDVEPADIQSVGVTLINDSNGVRGESINSSFNQVNQVNISDLGDDVSANVTGVDRVVANVTSLGNDGAIVNASIRAFENSTGSGFASDNSTGLVTTENTQTLDGGIATESTVDADEDGTPSAPTVNVSFQSVSSIDSNSVNISVRNLNVSGSNETVLVENGQVVPDSASLTSNSNFTTSSNNTVFANISAPALGEGFYTVNASVNTSNGNQFTNNTLDNRNSNFSFDRVGSQLELIPDSSNPVAGNFANLTVVVQDDDGNRLNFNESDVNVNASRSGELILTTVNNNDAPNTTTSDPRGGAAVFPVANTTADSPAGQFNVFFNASFSNVGDVQLEVTDTNSTDALLSSAQATQTFTGQAGGIELTTADGELTADGADTENVTLQLVDQNGNAIQRGGEAVNTFIARDNSTSASVSKVSQTPSGTTDNNGTSVASFNATNDGFSVEVFASATVSGTTFTDTVRFNTVPGDVNATNSVFSVDQSTSDLSAKAGTTHDINVTLLDSSSNAVPGTSVELSANASGVTFADQTPQTNTSGIATTTATLPETNEPVQINVSAGSFNASATGAAQNNVSVSAGNTTALQFASDSRSLPANQDDVGVTVEGVDEFGNVNTSDIGSVTLTSSDTNVFDFNGSESASDNAGDGTADFNVDVGASGTATLTATVANSDINNTSAEFSATGPSGVDVTFTSDVSTSSNGNTNSTATLNAQLVGPDGSSIAIAGEQVSLSASGPAELNQSGDFTPVTNANGLATYQVNATDQTGQTEITANALNFSAASGTGTITTTGPAADVSISFANDSVAQNNTTTVTTAFVDDSDRVVPRSGTITVQTINNVGEVDGSSTASNATALANDFEATYIFNASTTESNATLRALAPGIGQTEATINVTGQLPDRSITFEDKVVGNTSTDITVESATFNGSQSFNVVVHEATDDNSDGTIQPSEIGQKIGESAELDSGTQTDITVNISKQVDNNDTVSQLTEGQTLVAMLHTTNTSDDDGIVHTAPIREDGTQNTPPVFDDANITVSPLEGTTGDFDSDGDGELSVNDVGDAASAFIDGDLSIQEISRIAAEFIN